MKRFLYVLCFFVLFSGCSQPVKKAPQYDVSGRYLGLTTADLVQIKGAPGSVAVLPTGGSVWTYKSLMTNEKEQAEISAGSKPNTSWVETVSFMIDSAGRVTSYTTAVEQ